MNRAGVARGDEALLDWHLAPDYNYSNLMGGR
jgi:hypothetical protein